MSLSIDLWTKTPWNQILTRLSALGSLIIAHEPEDTRRYQRARTQVRYVLRVSVPVGMRPAVGHEDYALEVMMWCRAPDGRRCGVYTVFRIVISEEEPVFATLFCFWDGTDASACFKDLQSAKAYALAQGCVEVIYEEE
jgi:hypothetical protein